MTILAEARSGFFLSNVSSLLVSTIISIVVAFLTFLDGDLAKVLPIFLISFCFWIIFSTAIVALMSFAIGIPLYCLLRHFKLANVYFCTLFGGGIASLMARDANFWFLVISALYGVVAGTLFWYGSRKSLPK